ncbi:MAG: hypothetical protein A2293_08765 [Elusimicrobia bacterium RIFOXYB2_FULL_49_7]|nr:MAG: hypothetical protein A2293_08765 [Elusimicrobia bacterium RIFOXYB2_FULL_49_7]
MMPLSVKYRLFRKSLQAIKTPRFASLFLTRRCNLTCAYCKSREQTFPDMDLSQWKAVIDKLHGFGVCHFTLTGGEPLLRSDLFEIIRYITQEKKSLCWMISNFKNMTPDVIKKLAASGLDFVSSSLDTLDVTRNKGGAAVFDALAIAQQEGIVASILAVVTRENVKEIPALVDKAIGCGILFDMALYQHVGGLFSFSDTGPKVADPTVLRQLSRFLLQKKWRSGRIAPSRSFLKAIPDGYLPYTWKCSKERDLFLVVNNDGRLMPCQEWVTDIKVTDLAALKDPTWRLAKQEVVEKCPGCFYGCYFQKENITPLDALLDGWGLVRL